MDVETQPPLENGTKEEQNIANNSPNAESVTSDSPKPNLRSKSKRSRSRTPNSADEPKLLQKKKLQSELNGQDLKEIEEEKTEDTKEVENGNESIEELPKRRSKRNKEDTPKGEENKEDLEKKEKGKKQASNEDGENSKIESPEKQIDLSPKKDRTPKKEESTPKKSKKSETKEKNQESPENVEMEPLIISDEHDPELQFDESSDLESGKGSPVLANRCVTRRSQTRNIPTPKTPKSLDQDIDSSEKNSVTTEQSQPETDDLLREHSEEETNDSSDLANISTKADAGSDSTRMLYMEKSISVVTEDSPHDDSYLNEVRERSLSDTLRSLSARKPIRDDYRRRALRMAQERSDLNIPYSNHEDSTDALSSGVKRKNRSLTPEDRKKFKSDSPTSMFSSPFTSLRSKFRSEVQTSTPKLTSYKDSNNDLHFEENHGLENGIADKKNWCTVM